MWVDELWCSTVTRTKCFWDPVSIGWIMLVSLSLGPKVGWQKINATPPPLSSAFPSNSRHTRYWEQKVCLQCLAISIFFSLSLWLHPLDDEKFHSFLLVTRRSLGHWPKNHQHFNWYWVTLIQSAIDRSPPPTYSDKNFQGHPDGPSDI
jgi:hypothetical protein